MVLKLEPFLQTRLSVFDDNSLSDEEQMWDFYKPETEYVAEGVSVRELTIAGQDSLVSARLYQPEDKNQRSHIGLVWFHGGGFISGNLDVVEATVTPQEIVRRSGITVLSATYRLCNDGVTFPAPQNDGITAVQWFQEHASELGVKDIFVGGGSAGACLSGSLVQILRDTDKPQVAGTLLLYPIAHAVLPALDEWHRERHEALPKPISFDPEWAKAHNERLMGRPVSTSTGHDFPGDAKDLTGLPPTLIINAEFDTLAISGSRYAAQLAQAGVEVTTFYEPNVIHGHLAFHPQDLHAADHSINSMISFMKGHARNA